VHAFIPLPVADTECGLKVFHREKILPVLEVAQDAHWFWDTEIVHRAWRMGLKVSERWIVFVEDRKKASTVRLWHDTLAYLKPSGTIAGDWAITYEFWYFQLRQ